MHVKSLRLAGFKSFATPTILDFEPAVNVIVGPNGSGKSNIADALLWVLGSQAPSSLRGGSMEDVIFAGSQERPSLGLAEVEVTLDNSDRVIPLDLTELTIGRSTDRSGATEYRINGASCRLLDVTELLSDTGIGRSLHTVVGQGQLDAVLQARPEDRRAFIEEAAQIGKYRRRKDRALRKIERVDENLTRLADVLGELRRALRPLKRQATAAAAYSELLSEHRDLRQRLAATEVQRLLAEMTVVDPAADAHHAGLLADELAHVRALFEGAARERDTLAGAAEATQRLADRMGAVADRFTGLGRLATERASTIAARLAAETEEGYRERIRLLEAERTRWENEATALSRVASDARREAVTTRESAERATGERGQAEQAAAEARQRETEAAQHLVRAEGAEAAGRATLGSIEARVQAVIERREVASRRMEALWRAIADAEAELRALEEELDHAVGDAAEAETRLEAGRERVDELRADHALVAAGRAAAAARLEAFEEIRGLIDEDSGLAGLLRPRIDQARRHAGAAEQLVSHAATALKEAEGEVERLWQVVGGHDQEVRRLDALVAGATERLTARRRDQETTEVSLAALDEELARSRGELAEAERAAVEDRAVVPARRAELAAATSARSDADAAVTVTRAAEAEAVATANAAELQARTAEERALAAQLRWEEARAGIADAEAALSGLEELRRSLQARKRRAEGCARVAHAAAGRAREWARQAEARAAEAREEAVASESRFSSLHARERELAERLEEVARRRSHAEVRRAELRTRSDALGERAMEEWGLSIDDLLSLETFAEAEELDARERAEKLEREMRRLGAVNPTAAEEYSELAEREGFLEQQIEDLRSSRRDLLKIVREVDETMIQMFSTAFDEVAREFEGVFERLFPGGSGRLKLTDPDDPLGSGIEVEARPPGKNVRKLSLLSGGERSLVALAFLFAIFRARPSPFYLLDEVEAALDDINLQRFIGLVKELRERAQVLIVTHQKRTMESAEVLYGVSIGKDGVSTVVAKRMEEAAV